MATETKPSEQQPAEQHINLDAMNAEQLHAHIKDKEAIHRKAMTNLRALLRCKDGGAELLEKKPK